jgi:hypothetical protein
VREDQGTDYEEAIRLEREAADKFRAAAQELRPYLKWVWRWGDGDGGFILDVFRKVAVEEGLVFVPVSRVTAKAKISRKLSKQVMERDAYRCVTCGTHEDLCCDHIIPESKGGPTTYENLQTMCRPCNSRKGARE